MIRPRSAVVVALGLVLGLVLSCGCTIKRASPPATEPEELVLRRPPPPRAEVVTVEAAEPSPFLARVGERGRGEEEEEEEERATSSTSPSSLSSLFRQPSPLEVTASASAAALPRPESLPRTFSRPLAPPDGLAPLPEPEPEPEPRAATVAAVPLDEAFPAPAAGRRFGPSDPEEWSAPAPSLQAPPPVAAPRPSPGAEEYHVVVRGDTLWGIARPLGTTPRDICLWNPGLTPATALRVGQRLRLPGRGEPPSAGPPAPTGPAPVSRAVSPEPPPLPSGDRPAPPTAGPGLRIHVLQPGETLWTVARAYRTSVLELMKINRIGEASALRAGLELYVPATDASAPVANLPSSSSLSSPSSGARSASAPEAHVVQKGDTLWSVSRQYGVSVEQLLSWNDMGDLTSLPVGTRLLVARPSSLPSPTPSPSPRPTPPPSRPPSSVARPTPRVAPSPAPTRAAAAPPPASPAAPRPTNPEREATGEPGFDWPLRGEILKNFGWYDGRPHTGIDIAGKTGTQVKAAADGTVIFAGEMRGYGTVVILDHGDGYFTVYGNLLDAVVAKGTASRPSRVARGASVGRIGATVEGPQACLHFEIRRKNKAIAPLRFLTY